MSHRANELRKKRAAAVTEARKIIDNAEKRPAAEQRLNDDEERQYKAFVDDSDRLLGEIQREERLSSLETELGKTQADPVRPDARGAGDPAANPAELRSYRRYLQNGRMGLTHEEHRALQADSDTAGGFLVMPRQQSMTLLKAVDDLVFVRKVATVEQVDSAESLGICSLDSDPEDGDWTTEIKEVDDDDSMAFGDRELIPKRLVKGLKVSNKLMRSSKNPEGLVNNRLSYKMAVTEEKGFLTGSGAGRPLGVFVASNQGISTGRDMATGNLSTSMTADGLINNKYNIKSQYWARAAWAFHRLAVAQIAKLKDGDGQYLWQPSIQAGQPDRLLNLPIYTSEFAPSTFTSGQYVGIVGDWSFYWIADALNVHIQRLDELYARTSQTGFIVEAYCDGMPVLEEAFSRVKLG